MNKEIERKFLVDINILDKFDIVNQTLIEQNYLAIGEQEVRIRNAYNYTWDNYKYTLGIKKGNGLVRKETEIDITKNTYDQLNINHKPIKKVRHMIFSEGYVIEIDKYMGKLNGLYVAEIEFKYEDEAQKYNIADWIKKDVTDDQEYKNQNLWMRINGIKL